MKSIINFTVEKTCQLLNIASPSGYGSHAVAWLKDEFEALGFDAQITVKGGLIVDFGGEDNGNGLFLEAHCDTLGGMVAEIKANGRLRLTNIGGMNASAQALIAKFGEEIRENVESNVVDLLFRFQNKALKDTVARVGADPVRKLRRNDRIVGAALFAMEQGVDPMPVIKGIVAGLKFDQEGDPTAPEVQAALKEQGIEYVIEKYMGLSKDEALFGMIKAAYEA